VAVVGIGYELGGDDAAGVQAARELTQAGRLGGPTDCLVVEGGAAPENVTGILRKFNPQLVLCIDAADMGETPGSVRWIEQDEIDGLSASTHSLPLSMYAHYLSHELGCEVAILGIQPGTTAMGAPLSPTVQAAIRGVTSALCESLGAARPGL
jgi:hydrogenase maturation protease HycI